MRVAGFLFLFLASPVFASSGAELLRFAYASPLLADTRVDTTTVSKTSPIDAPASPAPEHRTLRFVAAANLLPAWPVDPPAPEKQAPAPPATTVATSEPALQQLGPDTAPAEAAAVAPSHPSPQRLAALTDPVAEAMPAPMHVLPPELPAQSPEPDAKPAASEDTPRRKAHPYKFPGHVEQDKRDLAKTGFVPAWAAQMFDTVWQQHTFSYQ